MVVKTVFVPPADTAPVGKPHYFEVSFLQVAASVVNFPHVLAVCLVAAARDETK
jgi:hypothetical protein